MARQPRLDVPGIPQHVVQRGNNRLPCFFDDGDRRRYLQLLHESSFATGCVLHAYVLMTNHVHLLLTPPIAGSVSSMMQKLGRQYVGQFNARHKRTCTLWEGRYKSCLVDSKTYVLSCYRYIELNPVRAAMVERPEQHRWSSVHANLNQRPDDLVTPHPVYLGLDGDPNVRAEAYRMWLRQGVSDDDLHQIRRHLQQERALGDIKFQAMIERALGRPATVRPRGRPPRPAE